MKVKNTLKHRKWGKNRIIDRRNNVKHKTMWMCVNTIK